MELAQAVYDAGQVHPGRSSTIQVRRLLTAADPVAGMHGVDTTELLEIPALYSLFSGKADDLMASIRGMAKVRDLYGQIHGGPVSDEQFSQPSGAVVWTEMCDQATWSASQQTLLAITGHVQYADAVERIVFNVFPGSTRPDGKAAQYFTAPNLVACTRTSCQQGTAPGRGISSVRTPIPTASAASVRPTGSTPTMSRTRCGYPHPIRDWSRHASVPAP